MAAQIDPKIIAAAGGAPQYNTAFSAQQAAAMASKGLDINSVMAGWIDRGAWLYYDRIYQPSTNNGGVLYQTYNPFQIGLNRNDAINTTYSKTKLFTNLPNGGQFNPPRCMVLRRLGFYFEPTMNLADIELFLSNAYVEFRIDEKIFFEGLLQFWPGGMGLTGATSGTGVSVWTNGIATPHAMRDYGPYSKYIAPLQNFSCTITCPTTSVFTGGAPTLLTAQAGGTGLNVVVMMDGVTDRSVQ